MTHFDPKEEARMSDANRASQSNELQSKEMAEFNWLDDDFDDEFWNEDPVYHMEVGLPLAAENFATGEPLVIVDYFDFDSVDPAAIGDALMTLKGAELDIGAREPRIMISCDDRSGRTGPLALIAIATVYDFSLRVETAQHNLTDSVRTDVETVLGSVIAHRIRVKENPCEV